MYISFYSAPEQQRDKRINRDDEYSDSEDEGDEPPLRARDRRKNEHSFRDTKRPRLMDETNAKNGAMTMTGGGSTNQAGKPPAVATGGGALSSPLPPEPSPITPLPQEDGTASKNKSKLNVFILNKQAHCRQICAYSLPFCFSKKMGSF